MVGLSKTMKTIYLAYACATSTSEFHDSMQTVARQIAALPEITINHSGQYPEVPASDVLWYQTYSAQIRGSDLIIAVLDFPSATIDRIIRNRSVLDLPLWCFFPRGTIVPEETVSRFINQHVKKFQHKATQRVFAYDKPSDISSWVASAYAKEP